METANTVKIEREEISIPESDQRLGLPAILRVLGVILIATASMTFLFQSWQGMTYLTRFLSFSGFSTLLLGSGIFLGLKVRDGTGARIFLYASLFCVPVIFSQLGAMILDLFSSSPAPVSAMAEFFSWKASSIPALVTALIVGTIASGLISGVTLQSVLKEKQAVVLKFFFALNALLLLPVRSDFGTGGLIVLATAILLLSEYINQFPRIVRAGCSSNTLRSALILPVLVLIGRAALLHDPGFFLANSILLAAGACFFMLPLIYNRALSLQYAGAFLITLVSLRVMDRVFPLGMTMSYIGYEFSSYLVAMGVLLFLSLYAGIRKQVFTRVVLAMFLFSILDRMFLSAEAGFVIYTIAGAASMVVISYYRREQAYFVFSVLTLGVALIKYVGSSLLIAAHANPWLSIALIGVAGIIAASVWEKHHYSLIRAWNSLGNRNDN